MNFLLIDDDDVSLILAKKILERTGLVTEVRTALNGAEAISHLNKWFDRSMSLPDVILLDLNMPVMDGFSFLDAFYKLPLLEVGNVRIIVVSSSDNPRDISKVRSKGVKDYLLKPLKPEELIRVLTT